MSSGMIRRLSISAICKDLMGSSESLHTRSLLIFGKDKALTENYVQIISTKYRLLKVLDFERYLVSVPKNWGNLAQHLKYLKMRCSRMPTRLPKFICELHNLETLDIRYTMIRKMPKELCKLRKLRHLLGGSLELFELKNGLAGLTSLQTLRRVKLSMDDDEIKDGDEIELIRELGKLMQLRNLRLIDVKEEHGNILCSSINMMTNLEKLNIESKYVQVQVIDLPIISSLPMLRKLSLFGNLKKFPELIPQLQNLVQLILRLSKLSSDPLRSLQNMPHLLFLEIYDAYEGKSLYFEDGGFRQLRILTLASLYKLESIIIDKGALHSLQMLILRRIIELKTIPLGIQHLKKLEVLHVGHMSDEFNECIAPDGGPEHPIIQHVPLVKITAYTLQKVLKTRVIHHSRHKNS